jgi:hypothetical protein
MARLRLRHRVKPRNVFNLGFGTDNLLHTEKREKVTASL